MIIEIGNYWIEKHNNLFYIWQVFNYDEQTKEIYECFEGVGIFNTKNEALKQIKKWNIFDKILWNN